MIVLPNVFPLGHYTADNIEKFLQKYLQAGDSVLDVGTGCGILAILAKKHGAGRVLAVDIQDEAVECATANANEKNLDIEVRKNYLNFDISEKFDLTIANLYANQSMEFLQYARNTMKDDGILILTWGNKFFSDLPIKADFTVIEQTEGLEYNTYVLR